jgi:GTP cyclohydrolase II
MRAAKPCHMMTGADPEVSALRFLQPLYERLAARVPEAGGLPFVTLSYAQSIDGSIAARPARPVALSCEQSLLMTHHLRARHCALLVGINTVLADDPRLTVRLCSGDNPLPVVLDSRLRISEEARLLAHPDRKPLLLTTSAAPSQKIDRLQSRGARVQIMPADDLGRVSLREALRWLAAQKINGLMVEGGATVIDSFLRNAMGWSTTA